MSTFLNVSFIPKKKEFYPELFNRLFDWVNQNCQNLEIEEILDSADYTKYSIESVEVNRVLMSDMINSIYFSYDGINSYELYGWLKLIGNKHGLGHYVKESGNVFFSIGERNIWGSYIRHYLEKEEYEKIEEHKITVLISLSELFNEWIELCEDLLQHASFYTEGSLCTRITSTMGYYLDYKDFVLDFQRILIESKSEHYFTEFYGKEDEYFFDLKNVNDTRFYNSFNDEERGNLTLLINSLNQEVIDDLKKLNEETIKINLEKSLINNPDIIFTDLENGFTLSTYPLKSLWTLYYDFLKDLKVSLLENLVNNRVM